MSLLFRGVVWFGLYVVLTLLPLAVALVYDPYPAARPVLSEISTAIAFVAYAVMMIQFALVSRLRLASEPFGSDALMQFHREMGIASLAFVLAHALLLGRSGVSWAALSPLHGDPAARAGAIALWVTIGVVLTSLGRRRLRLSYEVWRIVHLVGACTIAAASLTHVLLIGGYARTRQVRWTLAAYTGLFLLVLVRYRFVRPLVLWRRPWEVVSNDDLGGRTRLLRVRPVGHRGFRFDPGQFAWFATGRTPLIADEHPLSIASSAEPAPDGTIEFAIKALGDWSGASIPALSPGQRVWVDGAFGAFTPEREPGLGFVLIAGGIGIVPMRSMLLTMRDRGDARPVLLIYAAPDTESLVFRDEIEALRGTLNVRVIPVVSHPEAGWQGERGLITEDLLRRHLPSHRLRYQYFICGPEPLMDDVERILTGLGIPAARVHTERFKMV